MPEVQNFFEGFWGHVTEFIKRMKIVLAVFVVSLFVMLILPGNQRLQTPYVCTSGIYRQHVFAARNPAFC
jgi:Fe2+ transport system protein B